LTKQFGESAGPVGNLTDLLDELGELVGDLTELLGRQQSLLVI
jgi:hypothetical protein